MEGGPADRGIPAASRRGSTPHRWSCMTPARMRACVDNVSLPRRLRSMTRTRSPARASSRAVAAPATRAPTTTTSYVGSGSGRWIHGFLKRVGGSRRRHQAAGPVLNECSVESAASAPTPSRNAELRRRMNCRPSTYSPGAWGHTSTVKDLPLRIEHRDVQPGVLAPVAGGPHHSVHAAIPEVDRARRRGHGHGPGARLNRDGAGQSQARRCQSIRSSIPCILRSACPIESARSSEKYAR